MVILTYGAAPLKEFDETGTTVINIESCHPLRIIRRAVSIAREYKADVISTHFTRPLITGYIASLITGLPIIHNEHSSSHYRKGMSGMIVKLLLPLVDQVICNSDYTRGTIIDTYRISSEKVQTSYNPVKVRKAYVPRGEFRAAQGIDSSEIVIGHIGGMIPERDQETLVRAFSRVARDHERSRLLLISDGPKKAALEELVKHLGIMDKVLFPGYVTNVGDYLGIMDIYVNPTLDEGFGIAVVEAMSAGIPVVLSDRGAHPELVVDQEDGLLFAAGDSEALAGVLLELINRPDLRRTIGAMGRASALARFSPQHLTDHYNSLVEKTVRERH
ncbi:MAG: group 1 glycosyl [Geobacteraceae bacterium]|nr:MAG: group 1 glycosyl [Geobacteraceae bacterium]